MKKTDLSQIVAMLIVSLDKLPPVAKTIVLILLVFGFFGLMSPWKEVLLGWLG